MICDRWINDILIDLGAESRSTGFLESKWYSKFQNILPIGTKQFVIERKKEDLLHRLTPVCSNGYRYEF